MISILYPTDYIRKITYFDDIPVLNEIATAIIPENSEDLIERANLVWLKKQIGMIIDLYKQKTE